MVAVDIIIIVLLLAGIYAGWKKGLLTSLLELVGSILVFIIAYILKKPISLLLIEHFPFLKFNGIFEGITSLNVMIYEAIVFAIATLLVSILYKLILKLSGVFNKVLNSNFITGLPNKILGAIIGLLRHYVIVFIVIFIASVIPQLTSYVESSKLSNIILYHSPVLSNVTEDFSESIREINEVFSNIDVNSENQEINGEILDIMLKYNIISKETAISLHDAGKLEIDNFDEIISKY